jgi:hypothetical protein
MPGICIRAKVCLDARIGPTSRVSFGLELRRQEQRQGRLYGPGMLDLDWTKVCDYAVTRVRHLRHRAGRGGFAAWPGCGDGSPGLAGPGGMTQTALLFLVFPSVWLPPLHDIRLPPPGRFAHSAGGKPGGSHPLAGRLGVG